MTDTGPATWPVFRFETLDSTSSEARRRAVAGGSEFPFVVRADRQTQGRGRGTNRWWSDAGSLLFTLALDPAPMRIGPRHEPRLALIAALAVVDSLPGLGASIRWPNDVEIGGRKLAGVLPERVETDDGPRLLVGVGVNVSTRFDAAPDDVRRLATSVAEIDPAQGDDPDLLARWLAHFDRNRRSLVADRPDLSERCNALDSLSGREVRVRQGDRIIAGTGQGIDDDGGLILNTSIGRLTVYGGQVMRD